MTADLKLYPAMKDSGVEWLGEVPEHWGNRKLRSVLSNVTARNRPDLPLLSVLREKGVIIRDVSNRDQNHNYIPDDLTNYKVVREGQFVMNKMKAWQGSYGVSSHNGIVSPAYYVFDIKDVAANFFNLAIRSRAYVPFFTQASDGVRIGQWDLSQSRMREIPFLVPPLPEQIAIVRYLDYMDRRVRRLIRAKRKLIVLFNEQKQAIIHRAVTRGLNPDVPMKDSGVEWLGEVPAHWEVLKLRQCGAITGGVTPSMEVERYWNGDIPWVTPKDMKTRVIKDSSVRVTKAAIEETSLKKICSKAVLLVVRGMILARKVPIAWTMKSVTINQDMKAIRPRQEINARYLTTTLSSAQDAFVPLIDEAGHGTKRLPTERWKNLSIAVPPPSEQAAIVEYLDQATADIDIAIARITHEIDLLNEYRTRLIADVVTGKLDVREAAAALPEVDPLAAEADPDDALDTDTEVDLEAFDAIFEEGEA